MAITKADDLLIARFSIEPARLDRLIEMDFERSQSQVELDEIVESVSDGKIISIVYGPRGHVMRVIAILIDQGEAVLMDVRGKTLLEQVRELISIGERKKAVDFYRQSTGAGALTASKWFQENGLNRRN